MHPLTHSLYVHNGWSWVNPKLEAVSFLWSPLWMQGHRVRSKVEQPGLELALTQDASTTGRRLTCYTVTLASLSRLLMLHMYMCLFRFLSKFLVGHFRWSDGQMVREIVSVKAFHHHTESVSLGLHQHRPVFLKVLLKLNR